MIRFNKGYNFKVVSIIISAIFLFNSTLYSCPFSKGALRAPSLFQSSEQERRIYTTFYRAAKQTQDSIDILEDEERKMIAEALADNAQSIKKAEENGFYIYQDLSRAIYGSFSTSYSGTDVFQELEARIIARLAKVNKEFFLWKEFPAHVSIYALIRIIYEEMGKNFWHSLGGKTIKIRRVVEVNGRPAIQFIFKDDGRGIPDFDQLLDMQDTNIQAAKKKLRESPLLSWVSESKGQNDMRGLGIATVRSFLCDNDIGILQISSHNECMLFLPNDNIKRERLKTPIKGTEVVVTIWLPPEDKSHKLMLESILQQRGDISQSILDYALQLSEKIDDRSWEKCKALALIAQAQIKANQIDAAMVSLNKAINLRRSIIWSKQKEEALKNQCEVYILIAKTYAQIGQIEKAKAILREAVVWSLNQFDDGFYSSDMREEIMLKSELMMHVVQAYKEIGQTEEAKAVLLDTALGARAMALWDYRGDKYKTRLVYSMLSVARVLAELGEFGEAIKVYNTYCLGKAGQYEGEIISKLFPIEIRGILLDNFLGEDALAAIVAYKADIGDIAGAEAITEKIKREYYRKRASVFVYRGKARVYELTQLQAAEMIKAIEGIDEFECIETLISIAYNQVKSRHIEQAKMALDKAREKAIKRFVGAEQEALLILIAQAQTELGMLEEAIKTARVVSADIAEYDKIISSICFILIQRSEFRQAIEIANKIVDVKDASEAFVSIVSAQARNAQIKEALQTAGEITDYFCQAQALTAIINNRASSAESRQRAFNSSL